MSSYTPKYNIYDSVFTHLFRDPEYQLRLYKEMHPEMTDVTVDDIRDVTIESVLLNHLYNDLGFTIGDHTVFLIEAQSTWCVNMAFRSMLYLSDTLRDHLIKTKQRYYDSRPVRLPKPELYVLYTGTEEHDEEWLSLADVHWDGDDTFADVKVKILYGDDSKSLLSQYAAFTRIYRDKKDAYGATEQAVIAAIDECIGKDILKDYFTENRSEVINIMNMLYDAELNLKLFAEGEREEGKIEGEKKTLVKLLLDGDISEETALRRLECTKEELSGYIEMYSAK